MQNGITTNSTFFEIDANGTLIKIKESGGKLEKAEIPDGVQRFSDVNIWNHKSTLPYVNWKQLILPSSLQEISIDEYRDVMPLLVDIANHSTVLFDWWIKNHKYNGKFLNKMQEIDMDKYTNSDGNPFTKISPYLFNNKHLRKFNTGSFITEIGDFVFENCQNLEYAEIGKNIQFIGAEMFSECPKLKSRNVISHSPVLFAWWVENHKYDGKTLNKTQEIDLSQYTNSDGNPFTKIGSWAFAGIVYPSDTDLRKFNTGSFITEIGDFAFESCDKLKYVEIGENIQSMGENIFRFCSNLKSENFISHSPVLFDWWVNNHKYGDKTLSEMETIDLDKYTNSSNKPFTIISKYAFAGCWKTRNILFGNTIKQINEQNLRSYIKLKNIQISNKDVIFDSHAFDDISKSVNFYVLDKQIKEKLQRIGVDSKRIFIKPIPVKELEKVSEVKAKIVC